MVGRFTSSHSICGKVLGTAADTGRHSHQLGTRDLLPTPTLQTQPLEGTAARSSGVVATRGMPHDYFDFLTRPETTGDASQVPSLCKLE